MGAAVALVVLVFLMLLGVPIAFSFAGMTLTLVLIYGLDMSSVMTTGFWMVNSVILMALPLFIMAGYLMQRGGIAESLIGFSNSLIGRIKGGWGATLVVTSGIFGAMSGTATAATAAIGTILMPTMAERGYPRGYSAALLGISSLLAILIPPSITMILYAFVTRQSVAACFLTTVGPGILLMLILIVINAVYTNRLPGLKIEPPLHFKAQVKKAGRQTVHASPALLTPFIILGGIYGGVFTPTEASAVAVAYSIPIGFFVYRGLKLGIFGRSLYDAATTTGVIMIILLFSMVASRIFTLERIPQQLTALILGVSDNKYIILLMVNIFLIHQ